MSQRRHLLPIGAAAMFVAAVVVWRVLAPGSFWASAQNLTRREYTGHSSGASGVLREFPRAREVVRRARSRAEAEAKGYLNSLVFETGNFRRRYLFYPEHINFVDPQTGEIVEADPAFAFQSDGSFAMQRASYTAQAPAFADGALSFTVDGETVTFTALGMGTTTLATVGHVAGVPEGNRVTYPDAFAPGADLVIQAEPDELRKLAVFRVPPPFAEDFRVEFATSLQVESEIRGRNTQLGKTHFRQPSVWDSGGVTQPITVHLTAGRLAKVLPAAFFTGAGRPPDAPPLQYPVTTDVTTSYYAGAGDGYVYYSTAFQSWATAHAETGDNNVTADYTGTTAKVGSQNDSGGAIMRRAFLPADTSGIADNDEITAARLNIYATAKNNGDNDGNDYLVVVQTSAASTSSLTGEDYDQCGTVTDPTAGSATVDIGDITTSAYNTFTLNSTGEGWISKTGTTQLGLREGHDAVNDAVTASATDDVTFSTSENTGTSQDPYLEVDTTAAAITKVVRTNDDGKEIFATSTEGLLVTSTFVGETNGNTTIEYVVFMDLDADNTPDTNETYVTNSCAGSGLWSANNYTKQTSAFTIADGASPKTDSWECSTASFPEENGVYKIYTKWYDANGTIVATGTPSFQFCDQPTGTTGWWDTSYENRVLLNLRAATFTEALVDFPVLVKATTTNFGFDDPDSSSHDVRFLDEDTSTELNYEREYYDATTTQEAYWWVQVPKVATSTDCDYIFLYYDKAGAADTSTSTATWRQDYYEAVWHFGESATSSATTYNFQDGVSPDASYAGTEDLNLESGTATTNQNADTTIQVDGAACSGGGATCRALMQWDISTIPASCTVSSASITINVTNATANGYAVFGVRRNWGETTATWNTYDGTNNWSTAGVGDTTNDRYSTDLMNGNANGGWGDGSTGSQVLDFDSDGLSYLDDLIDGVTTNNGFVFYNESGDNDSFQWSYRGNSTGSNRPKLTVNCGSGTDDTYLDSTLNNHDETNSTIAARAEKGESKFGYSPKFDGASGSGIGIPDSTGFDLANYTITGWFQREGAGDAASYAASGFNLVPFVTKGYAEADTQAADIHWAVGVGSGGQTTLAAAFEDDTHSNNDHPGMGAATISNNIWYHFGYYVDGGVGMTIYRDGWRDNTTTYTFTATPNTGGTQKVGIATGYKTTDVADGGWQGYLDEIRIHKALLSTDWLKAEWYTADNGMVEWGTEATTTAALQISSAANQTFILGGSATAISTITITDGSAASITDANNIRIRIPSTFNMTFDTSDALANIGGTDWAKTGAGSQGGTVTVSYEDSNKTAVVPVTTDFDALDDITVYGISFTSFTAVSSADNLEIEVDNGGTIADTDDKTITIVAPTLSSFINQTFTTGQPKATSSAMTITDASTAFITAANDIRIRIPSTFNMTWDATNPIVTVAPTLDDYTSSFSTNDLPVATIDVSGVTYSSTTDSLFVVVNGTPTIYEYTLGGDWVRTVSMNGFIDTEGIDWMYGNTFVVTEERDPYDIIVFDLDQSTTTLAISEGTVIDVNITCTTNLCLEGIAYDVANDWFYAVSEKQAGGGSGGRVFKIENDGTATEYTTLGTALSDAGYTDLADIAYDPVSTNLFLLSEENNTIIEATTTGTIVNTFAVDTGIFTQPEGLSFTPDGDSMFIVGESDDYQHLTRDSKIDNACTFEDSNKTLVLNVTSDFSASESRTIGLMSFANFTAQSSADNLELEVMNNGSSNDEDDKTIEITGDSLSVTASSTVLAFAGVNYSFNAQTSTAANVGGTQVAGSGSWTLNLNCNVNPSNCAWRGATQKDRYRVNGGGVAPVAVPSTTGVMCVDAGLTCTSTSGDTCSTVTLSGAGCFGTGTTVTLATGSSADGTFWFAEQDWAQGIPAITSSGVYTTTISFDLQ